MKRKGFALLPSLWLLVVIATLVGTALQEAHLSVTGTRNRLSLTRAEWAREACVSILKGRYHRYRADTLRLRDDRLSARLLEAMSLDSIPLGERLWCRTRAVDAAASLNVNLANRRMLLCVLGDSLAVEEVLAGPRGPGGAALARLLQTRREAVIKATPYLNSYGTGQVNVNTAPLAVLRCIPGLGEVGARQVESVRRRTGGFASLAAMVAALSPDVELSVTGAFDVFSSIATTVPPQLIIRVSGGAGVPALEAELTLVTMTGGTDLLILERGTE
jgi:type II secretory pathway component PulK